MLKTIVVSKDRPAQLDLWLRSYQEFCQFKPSVVVIWKAITDENRRGIECLMDVFTGVSLIEETDIEADVKLYAATSHPYIQFCVDDDCFVAPFGPDDPEFKAFSEDEDCITLTLRMAPYMDYCYTENIKTPPPMFRKDRAWWWPGLRGDWGYPNSIDGNIYRTKDLAKVIQAAKFNCPNYFEPSLRPAMTRPLMMCYETPRLVTIPNNSVQDGAPMGRNACTDLEELNRRFMDGDRLDFRPFCNLRKPSPHFEQDYVWESRDTE